MDTQAWVMVGVLVFVIALYFILDYRLRNKKEETKEDDTSTVGEQA